MAEVSAIIVVVGKAFMMHRVTIVTLLIAASVLTLLETDSFRIKLEIVNRVKLIRKFESEHNQTFYRSPVEIQRDNHLEQNYYVDSTDQIFYDL